MSDKNVRQKIVVKRSDSPSNEITGELLVRWNSITLEIEIPIQSSIDRIGRSRTNSKVAIPMSSLVVDK